MTIISRLAFFAIAHDHTGSPVGKGQGTARESVVLDTGLTTDAFEPTVAAEAFVKRARTTATPVMVGGAYEKRLAGVMGVVATGVVEEMPAGRMRICDEGRVYSSPPHKLSVLTRAQPPHRDR